MHTNTTQYHIRLKNDAVNHKDIMYAILFTTTEEYNEWVNNIVSTPVLHQVPIQPNVTSSDTFLVNSIVSQACRPEVPYWVRFYDTPQPYHNRHTQYIGWAVEMEYFELVK
jgi:hypothetical protein